MQSGGLEMQLIDSHVMMESLSLQDLEAMSACGIKAIIADAAGGMDYATSAQAATNYFEHTLVGEAKRASEYFIDIYTIVGINMNAVCVDHEKILGALPEYMKKEKVVGIGEVGLEPKSGTCPDLSKQEEILKTELRIAGEHSKPVILHLPATERTMWIERYTKLMDKVGFERSKAIIVHADANTTKTITEAGCMAGLSVLPMRRMTPEDAAKIVSENDMDRILVSSDSRIRHRSDPLSVPRIAVQMRRLGMKEEDVKKVLFDNPNRTFDLKLK
jgi:predicted metal-dependent TIM-barrel fold hydrolase